MRVPVEALVLKYPRTRNPAGEPISYSYGTAGFRTVADVLDAPMARVGLLAALLSASHPDSPVVGVMITASHNANKDNGVKIMDHHGEMIAIQWEQFASKLANVDEMEVWNVIDQFAKAELGLGENWVADHLVGKSKVFIGYDTRTSSIRLKNIVSEAVRSIGARVYDHGLVTTPQLHWIVREFNKNPDVFEKLSEEEFDGKKHLQLYNKNLKESFLQFLYVILFWVLFPPLNY